MGEPPEVIGESVDPEGRLVELTTVRWHHIVDGYPELAPHQQLVLRAVSVPDRRAPGRWPDEEWYYLATSSPSRWIKVVVRYAVGRGQIATAFPRRSFP